MFISQAPAIPVLELPTVPPPSLSAEELRWPDVWNLSFEGFGEEAFAILKRLREHPHIDQYREEKEGINRHLTGPFKRYRDDLVVNWVLPNRLDFETEKNVFSRLLKNDFGAGGCHHHLWMAFYRPGRRRLTDAQLSHSISPDGLSVGLYVGDYAGDLLQIAKERIHARPHFFLELINPLLAHRQTQFSFYYGSGQFKERRRYAGSLHDIPEDLQRAQGIWVRTLLDVADVVTWQGELVTHALRIVQRVWPVYRFLFDGTT